MKLIWRVRFVLALASVLGCASPAKGQDSPGAAPEESPARDEVEELIEKNGADVAVAFRSLDGTQELFIQPDKQFPAVSTIMRIPVMVELYAEAQAGELRLTDALPVHNGFHSLVNGSFYRLDPKEDSDPDIYKALDNTITLRELCEDMIARDSNLAANLLVEKLGIDRIRQRLRAMHADGMEFVRGFEGSRANNEGPNNTTSARGLLELLWALAKDEAVSPEASQEMIGIMARASPHEAASTAPPPETRTGRKSVAITGTRLQATIVSGAHSFVLVILAGDIANPDGSAALMAQIGHAVAADMY